MSLDFSALWPRAQTYDAFVAESHEHCALWTGVYRLARVPAWALERACAGSHRYRLLAVAEDWCGDASSTLPYVAKLGDQARCLELRVLRRDEHPDVMERYLTGRARSIPIVILLDEDWHEIGHWGPRPAALQAWVMEARQGRPMAELFPELRRWYARDQGATTLREILDLLPHPTPSVAPARREQ